MARNNNVNNTQAVENQKQNIQAVETKKEKTLKIHIPIDPLNPKDKKITVGINEKYATIERGVETEVSIPVYEQLKNAGLV